MRGKAYRWVVLDELLKQQDWLSQGDIASATGLHKQSIGFALRDLISGNLVEFDTDERALLHTDGKLCVRPIKVYRATVRRIK